MCTAATSIWTSRPPRHRVRSERHSRETVLCARTKAQQRAADFVRSFVWALHYEARKRDIQPPLYSENLHRLIPEIAAECGLARSSLYRKRGGLCPAVVLVYGTGSWASALGLEAYDRSRSAAAFTASRHKHELIAAAKAFCSPKKPAATQ